MFTVKKFEDVTFNVDVGDLFIAEISLNKTIGQRPIIILKVFPQENRVLIAPLSTNLLVNKPGSITLKSNAIHGFKKDASVLLSHMTTCDIDILQLNLGKIPEEKIIEIFNTLGFIQRVGLLLNNHKERPKVLICGPHGYGSGIEKLRALAHNITQQQEYEGIVLVDMPERPDLILKRRFQLYALKSIGVIVYFSEEFSGACHEFDWAAELDVFTVGIVSNHLPTEMLAGLDMIKPNVKIIHTTEAFPQRSVYEAVDWIGQELEHRISILSDCC